MSTAGATRVDLGVIAGLAAAVVVAGRRLLPTQLARSGASARGRWAVLIAAVTALGLVVLGNTEMLLSSYQHGPRDGARGTALPGARPAGSRILR